MAEPLPGDVVAFIGRTGDAAALGLAAKHLPAVRAMVRAYVRGKGFDASTDAPSVDLAAVIVSSCARLVVNPTGTVEESIGELTIRHGTFSGWTLPELAVLHQYRKRAM
ncbi:hypothetical protein [Solicola gregarius]|uniref:Uncharacterized protein n=1 Tax=Solicola gregarius TaxID=2908642 RepID=A0AA46YJD2_9ACTN|nr:hypothetical protein [Solicola gregarius]UYM04212.1 hypothetical protein L0C25_16905 [Solicola gregarius]